MPTYIDDNAIGEDAEKASKDDQTLAVRFTVEKRLNHALMTKVQDTNRGLEERAKLLEHAGKFDEAKAERDKKYPDEPIYRELEFITIHIPGDKTLNVHRPVMPADKSRFRAKYEAFKQGRGEPTEGTPLERLPEISHSQIQDLAYVGVKTIEALAKVADSSPLLNMMGGRGLKDRAADWVKANRASSMVTQTNDALRERDARIDALEKQIQELLATKAPAKEAAKASK